MNTQLSRVTPAACRGPFLLYLLVAIAFIPAAAQDSPDRKAGTVTGLPLPRFVSLKADEVNARVGPGSDYPIAFVFHRAGLPVEILAEFENWRKIRDSDGGTGWVASALVSGRRTAIVTPWVRERTLIQLMSSKGGSTIVAQMEPKAILDIVGCDGEACEAYVGNTKGWVGQKSLWGVYPGETVK